MANFKFVHSLTFIILLGAKNSYAVPLETVTDVITQGVETIATNAVKTAEVASSNNVNLSVSPVTQPATGVATSEEKEHNSASLPPNAANSGNAKLDSSAVANSLYANLLSPESIQQYINQFGATYPGYPAYPAPVGYATAAQPPPSGAGPIYSGPYVVQTGYEGYLVPATTAGAEGSSNSQFNNHGALLNPLSYLTNFFSVLMMSAVFRIVATVLGAIAMIFFGGALSRFVCNFTPICQVANTAVEFLRSDDGAGSVGRMLADGMTPERVRRATAFVQNAIRKYQELQKLVGNEQNDD